MTPTTRLEGLLPADGAYTKTEQIIAEAVEELRDRNREVARLNLKLLHRWPLFGDVYAHPNPKVIAGILTLGIAGGLLAGWVW